MNREELENRLDWLQDAVENNGDLIDTVRRLLKIVEVLEDRVSVLEAMTRVGYVPPVITGKSSTVAPVAPVIDFQSPNDELGGNFTCEV